DGGNAKRFAVFEFYPQPPGKVVGRSAATSLVSLVDKLARVGLGQRAPHLWGGEFERAYRVRRLPVMPDPCNQPSIPVVGISDLNVTGMALDLTSTNRIEIKKLAALSLRAATLRRVFDLALARRIVYSVHCQVFHLARALCESGGPFFFPPARFFLFSCCRIPGAFVPTPLRPLHLP